MPNVTENCSILQGTELTIDFSCFALEREADAGLCLVCRVRVYCWSRMGLARFWCSMLSFPANINLSAWGPVLRLLQGKGSPALPGFNW